MTAPEKPAEALGSDQGAARALTDGPEGSQTRRAPRRVQLSRRKGYRKPEGVVVVSRPSKWGNPYAVKPVDKLGHYPFGWRVRPEPSVAAHGHIYASQTDAIARAIELFTAEARRPSWAERVAELRGKDLACWCPLDQPCHADILLRLANPADETNREESH